MGRVTKLSVRNFKSIRERVDISFPDSGPLVIVGPNNVGKSNLVRALELVLGESWPGSFQPEDHDFFDRDRANSPIEITIEVDGVVHAHKYGKTPVKAFCLTHSDVEEKPFFMVEHGGKINPFVSNETREQCRTILI